MGRSFDDAELLIDQQIAQGNLPATIREFATARQRKVLDRIGISYPDDISKLRASHLITQNTPPTDRQLDFLAGLGHDGAPPTTKNDASKLIDRYTQYHPMSDGQKGMIKELGGRTDIQLTYSEASEFIDYLFDLEPSWSNQCNKCGTMNPPRDHYPCGAFLRKLNCISPPDAIRKSRRDKKSNRAKQSAWARLLAVFGRT